MFLLNRYLGAYIDAIGLKDLAAEHARKSREFITRIRAKLVEPSIYTEQEKELEAAVNAIKTTGTTNRAKHAAEIAFAADLVEAGAIPEQAEDAARDVSIIIFELIR